jgi:PAS domain S-box-containing protein
MRIQSKILILVIIFLCVFLLFLLVYTQSQSNVKNMLVRSDKLQKEDLINSILNMQWNQQFNRFRADIYKWDASKGLIHIGQKQWLDQNISPLLKTDGIDCIWLYDTSGQLIYFTSNKNLDVLKNLQFSTLMFEHIFQTSDGYFHKYTTEGFIVLNGMTISNLQKDMNQSKTKFYLVIGKIWNPKFFSTFGRNIGYKIRLTAYDQNLDKSRKVVKGNPDDQIIINLLDENNRPVADLIFSRANQVLYLFDELSLHTILYFFLIAAIMTLVSLLLLKKWINTPLEWISHCLRSNNPAILSKLERDTTEFGEIAQLVDNFYSQKKLLEIEMEERKSVEDTLRQSENKNRALLKAIPDYMFIVDENGIIIDYNSQPNNNTNVKISEFLNHKLSDLLPASIAAEALEHEKQILANQDAPNQEFSLNIDDDTRYYEARFAKCSDTTVLIMVRDVTDLKASERALRMSEELNRAIVEGSPLGITVRSNTGKLLSYNRAWRNIWAITDEVIELDLSQNRDEIHFDSRDDYLNTWQDAVKQVYNKGGTLYIPEARTLGRRPGSAEWIAQYFYAIMDQKGKVDRVVIITEDISERKRGQVELLNAKEQAEDASRAKTVFLANMSHEMRTPLNGILGMVQIIMDRELQKENREQMHIIQSSAQVLLQLITQILDYSKLEAENLKMEMTDFSIRELFSEIQKKFRSKALQKNLSLEINIDPEVPGVIYSDSKRILQVVSNLVDNGIKFSSEGSVICKVQIETGMSEVMMLHVSVKDQGIGIQADRHDKVFKSFIQTDAEPSQYTGSSGLGLAICKRIMEQMNGKIWLESEVGKGATFHFMIPVSLIDNHIQVQDFSHVSEPVADIKSSDQLRIIVAEDNLINQKVLVKILERMGHKIGLALDGKQAITLWEKEPYDLILMDIQMPEMNGIEATIHIREQEKKIGGHIPIVAVTAYAMVGDKEKFLVAGMDEYIPKPINVNQLQTILQKIIEWKQT